MEVEACPISISSVGTSPPRNRKRRSSTSSTSLSPGFAKENCLVSKSVAKRKRTISESKQQEKQQHIQQLRPTFWGWSPKQAKFKPKVMDGDGSLSDHPNPDSLALRSKWQPIVIESFYYLNFDNSSNHRKSEVFKLWIVHFHRKSFFKSKLVFR